MNTNREAENPERIGTGRLTRRLGVTRVTVDRWIRAGTFPAPHYLGSRRAWFTSEVEAWELRRMAELADPARRPGGVRNLGCAIPGAGAK